MLLSLYIQFTLYLNSTGLKADEVPRIRAFSQPSQCDNDLNVATGIKVITATNDSPALCWVRASYSTRTTSFDLHQNPMRWIYSRVL